MAEPFIGQISCFACSFSPRGWAYCSGQTMSISQFTTLYAVIGTIYGGDGTTNFLLPNLQGHAPMHWGNGPGGFNTSIGELQGTPAITLTTQQVPAHNHAVTAVGIPPGGQGERSAVPSSTSFLSASAVPAWAWKQAPPDTTNQFSPKAIGVVGGSQPHENMQPYVAMNLCMAIEGVFPSRN